MILTLLLGIDTCASRGKGVASRRAPPAKLAGHSPLESNLSDYVIPQSTISVSDDGAPPPVHGPAAVNACADIQNRPPKSLGEANKLSRSVLITSRAFDCQRAWQNILVRDTKITFLVRPSSLTTRNSGV